jgi:hypothetical protein
VDNIFFAPGGPMPSDRWSSTIRQQRLFNPHLWIKDAVADPSLATEVGEDEYDGRPHELLEIADDVAPLVLWVDSETGRVSNETSLVLGKYLSPRLYVSWGVSLTESINTIKMRYTLDENWTIKTEAGKERAADLVFTIEK